MVLTEFILVTGFYGAGNQLTRVALDNLEYLRTAATRPPEPEEVEHGSINNKVSE